MQEPTQELEVEGFKISEFPADELEPLKERLGIEWGENVLETMRLENEFALETARIYPELTDDPSPSQVEGLRADQRVELEAALEAKDQGESIGETVAAVRSIRTLPFMDRAMRRIKEAFDSPKVERLIALENRRKEIRLLEEEVDRQIEIAKAFFKIDHGT